MAKVRADSCFQAQLERLLDRVIFLLPSGLAGVFKRGSIRTTRPEAVPGVDDSAVTARGLLLLSGGTDDQ